VYKLRQKPSRYETLTSAKNEGILTRKTTQDSGYHGSDTHSPAGWGGNLCLFLELNQTIKTSTKNYFY